MCPNPMAQRGAQAFIISIEREAEEMTLAFCHTIISPQVY